MLSTMESLFKARHAALALAVVGGLEVYSAFVPPAVLDGPMKEAVVG